MSVLSCVVPYSTPSVCATRKLSPCSAKCVLSTFDSSFVFVGGSMTAWAGGAEMTALESVTSINTSSWSSYSCATVSMNGPMLPSESHPFSYLPSLMSSMFIWLDPWGGLQKVSLSRKINGAPSTVNVSEQLSLFGEFCGTSNLGWDLPGAEVGYDTRVDSALNVEKELTVTFSIPSPLLYVSLIQS